MLTQMDQFTGAQHWPVAEPDSVGVNSDRLAAAYDAASRIAPIQSLLVARYGRLVGEQYFGPYSPQSEGNIRSITKSVVSALVGIALHEGYIQSLDSPIAAWLPEISELKANPHAKEITLRHLLTMSAGLWWIENTGGLRRLYRSTDWVRFILSLPATRKPGEQFNYNTTLSHLTSVILTRASGMSTLAFAERFLFHDLGIQIRRWDTDPQGICIGGTDLYLTPRQLLMFGQLYLQQGSWPRQQLVPRDWVSQSTQKQIALDRPGFWNPAYTAYGYSWWLRHYHGHAAAVASGYAGQNIVVLPSLALVVVTTANAEVPYSGVMMQANLIDAVIDDYVIPSIQEV